MTIRLIHPDEWVKVAPIFDAEGGTMPDIARSTAAVAVNDAGEIRGIWTLQLCWHAGPAWIHPEDRGTGLWRKLHAVLDGIFQRKGGTGYYSFSGSEKMDVILTKLGYKALGYKVWTKEVA